MSLDEVKARIRKLLNLANNDGAAEGEIDNALRFARRLMLENQLTEDDVRDSDEQLDPHEVAARTEYAESKNWTATSHVSEWENALAAAIEQLIGTIGRYRSGREMRRNDAGTIEFTRQGRIKKACSITFYGPAEDVEDASTLFREWSETIIALARMKHGGALRGPGRSYAEGFAYTLWRKVREIQAEELEQIEAPEQTSTALVLAGARQLMQAKRERGSEWLAEQGTTLHSVRQSSSGNHYSGAYRDGQGDGERAEFSRNRPKRLT